MALQRCAIQSGMPTGVLCGAVQELCRCLTPLLQRGNLLDLEMLDIMRKDSVTPAPTQRASSLRPRVEEPISVPTPMSCPLWSPRRLLTQKKMALMQRKRPPAPPWFTLSLEDTALPVSIPPGAQVDLSSLETLQVKSLITP